MQVSRQQPTLNPSPFTSGVSSIMFAATSTMNIGPTGASLVRTPDGRPFIGIAEIGDGLFILSGDSNAFSNDSDVAYSEHDNGVLVRNICDQASFPTDVEIDIKPGSDPNCFNNNGHGVIPVAILSSNNF